MKQEIAIKFGGAAGQGVKTAGYIITKTLKDLGWWTFSYSEYPSLIRGGHSTFQINISSEKIYSATMKIDLLVALNEETVNLHYEELNKGGTILLDDDSKLETKVQKYIKSNKIQVVEVPVNEIVEKNKGQSVMENSVIVGAVWALFSQEHRFIESRIKKIFKKKAKDIETNLNCTKDGFKFVHKNKYKKFNLTTNKVKNRIIGTGNEVAGLASYAAGCRLYCAYPMTPSTGILHFLAARAEETGMVVKQAEDEISAIQMAIGGSYSGTRAACGTSGGGLALMTESLSLIGMIETPLVVFDSQRPGPATGTPTWTEQGDLLFSANAGHGDFPRIVIAPGDIDEVYELVPQAFNLADKYQTLVIVLLDKYLSESWYQTDRFKASKIKVKRGQIASKADLAKELDFKRYKYTVTGISPRSFPGSKKGIFLANSDEHSEEGYSTEDLLTRKNMMEKRMRKHAGIKADLPEPKLYGPKSAKTTVVCWGSQKGPMLDAINEINEEKARINMLHFSYVLPVIGERLKSLSKKNKIIVVENNYSGQFATLLRGRIGFEANSKINKYVGTPFFKDELIESLRAKL